LALVFMMASVIRATLAISLTEETDAVVVVVSEESGGLSVAMDGGITRYLKPQTLYEVLIDSLIDTSEETDAAPEVGPDEDK